MNFLENTLSTLFATGLASFAVLRIQTWLQDRKEKHSRQFEIFTSLYATRMAKTSYEHVVALNKILLEFRDDSKIIEVWKDYFKHLNTDTENFDDAKLHKWCSEKDIKFFSLLTLISRKVGYGYEHQELQEYCYSPIAFNNQELLENAMKHGFAEWMLGRRSVRVIVDEPEYENSDANQTDYTSPPKQVMTT